MSSQEIVVSIALDDETIRVGKLWFHTRKGKESASFEYDSEWLNHPEKFALEPVLKLTQGSFHTRAGFSLFGAIGDSAPDRWGRILMRRAQKMKDGGGNGVSRTLLEIDYLLGVNDETRQGAMRFSIMPKNEIYLTEKSKVAIPPLIYLPKLLLATERFVEDEEDAEDIRLLLAPGSSLGGARPKASVRDRDGSLAIAKFPKKDDEYNVVLWEAVALTLAEKAGIRTPAWHIEPIFGKSILIVKRFDRLGQQRIPFLSARSMISAYDDEQHSYIEMAYALAQHGAAPSVDMNELWRRIILTIMISNTDDHLRNHGFIYERYQGWRLSPVYDINPTPIHIKPRILTTAISLYDTTASLDTAVSVANEFRVSADRAQEIIREVSLAVKDWRSIALNLGLSKAECDNMASAFHVEN